MRLAAPAPLPCVFSSGPLAACFWVRPPTTFDSPSIGAPRNLRMYVGALQRTRRLSYYCCASARAVLQLFPAGSHVVTLGDKNRGQGNFCAPLLLLLTYTTVSIIADGTPWPQRRWRGRRGDDALPRGLIPGE